MKTTLPFISTSSLVDQSLTTACQFNGYGINEHSLTTTQVPYDHHILTDTHLGGRRITQQLDAPCRHALAATHCLQPSF